MTIQLPLKYAQDVIDPSFLNTVERKMNYCAVLPNAVHDKSNAMLVTEAIQNEQNPLVS